jgi:hypothetical protein
MECVVIDYTGKKHQADQIYHFLENEWQFLSMDVFGIDVLYASFQSQNQIQAFGMTNSKRTSKEINQRSLY